MIVALVSTLFVIQPKKTEANIEIVGAAVGISAFMAYLIAVFGANIQNSTGNLLPAFKDTATAKALNFFNGLSSIALTQITGLFSGVKANTSEKYAITIPQNIFDLIYAELATSTAIADDLKPFPSGGTWNEFRDLNYLAPTTSNTEWGQGHIIKFYDPISNDNYNVVEFDAGHRNGSRNDFLGTSINAFFITSSLSHGQYGSTNFMSIPISPSGHYPTTYGEFYRMFKAVLIGKGLTIVNEYGYRGAQATDAIGGYENALLNSIVLPIAYKQVVLPNQISVYSPTVGANFIPTYPDVGVNVVTNPDGTITKTPTIGGVAVGDVTGAVTLNPAIPQSTVDDIAGIKTGVDVLTDIATALPEGTKNQQVDKFKLMVTTKFPFSLPWDLLAVVGVIATTPITPRILFDENFTVSGHTFPFLIDINFNFLDPYIMFFRTFEIISFCLFLIMVTRKILGGAS
jgi:hypothetical protein